jgi:CubicO group peptidase (beta-lactamase class C family)
VADVQGEVTTGWEPVADAFRENFARRGEVGASVCVVHRGRVVVDLAGGTDGDRPWTHDTLALVFSTTKGLVATALLMLADRGKLDYDAPIGTYWPELGARLGAGVTVRTLLNHRAGTSVIDTPLRFADFANPAKVAGILEAQPATWEPGTAQGYGGTAWGMYAGELFRRIAGESVGTFFRREIAEPLGVDAWIGAPEAIHPRVARLIPLDRWDRLFRQIPAMATRTCEGRLFRNVAFRKTSFSYRAFANPGDVGPETMQAFNRPELWAAELPWCNAIVSARALARIYGALALGGAIDGVRLVSPAAIEPLKARQSWEHDRVLCKELGFAQGYTKEEPHLFSPNPASFGHAGTGGSIGWCDPDSGLAIGYVMSKLDWRVRSPRAIALCQAAAAVAAAR